MKAIKYKALLSVIITVFIVFAVIHCILFAPNYTAKAYYKIYTSYIIYYFLLLISTIFILKYIKTSDALLLTSLFLPLLLSVLIFIVLFIFEGSRAVFTKFFFWEIIVVPYIMCGAFIGAIPVLIVGFINLRWNEEMEKFLSKIWNIKRLIFTLSFIFTIGAAIYITEQITSEADIKKYAVPVKLFVAKKNVNVYADIFQVDELETHPETPALFRLEQGDVCTPIRQIIDLVDLALLLCQKGEGWVVVSDLEFEIIISNEVYQGIDKFD